MINESVSSEVKGYDTETYTVNDTIVVKGLSSNDTSLVPKTTVKDGVTLSLVDVNGILTAVKMLIITLFQTVTVALRHIQARIQGKYLQDILFLLNTAAR